jgi:hypothetical protein
MARMGFSSRSSSTVSMGGTGTAMETKVRAAVPVPHGLTSEQIETIQAAFRKAGIEFECVEGGSGTYTFGFTVKSRETQP